MALLYPIIFQPFNTPRLSNNILTKIKHMELHFDGKEFILKFPTIDDICNEIHSNPKEVLLLKIDISRAFHNLRVDPCDVLAV